MANPFDQFDAAPTPQGGATPAPQGGAQSSAPPSPAANPFDRFDPAPITDSGTTMGFADEAPKEASSQLSADDTKQFYRMLQGDGIPKASANELRDFVASKGHSLTNAEQIVAQRDSGRGIVGQINYPLPKPADPSSATGAALRGATQGASLGFGDELHGVLGGAKAALSGGSFSDAYDSTVDADRGRLAADEEQHPYASIAGSIVGGLALPVGLEKAGVTAGLDAVAVSAYRSARLEGFSAGEARTIAQRSVTWRLAKEGSLYGGAYGAGTADGDAGERLLGAGAGAAMGAALPVGARLLAPVLRPIADAGASVANAVGNAGRSALSPFTRGGAEGRAAGILRNALTRPADEALSNIRSAAAPVEGVAPTLAEVAGDPGLAGLQRGHANTDLNTAAAMSERYGSNALARTQAVSNGLGDGSPQAIQDFASSELGKAERATDAQQSARQAGIDQRLSGGQAAATDTRTAAEANLRDALEAIGPTADRDATGAAARDSFQQAYDAAKGRTHEAYSAPALLKPQPIQIPQSVFLRLRDAADAFYGDGGGEIPPRLQSILSDMADPNATTRTLTNIDRRLADFAGEARMQGRRSEGAFAEQVRSDLGAFAQRAAPPEYRDALTNAKAVRAEQGRTFETGAPATAFARDRFGNPSVGDNMVPSRLVRPGAAGGDAAESLIQAIGPEAAESTIRQEIRRVAEERGVASSDQARALTVRYGEAARRFPAVKADLGRLQQRAAELDDANGVERSAMSARPSPDEVSSVRERHALHDALLASPMSRVADPATDPSSFVAQLLRRSDDGRQLRSLHAQIKAQPDAQAGFRRALGDFIVDAGHGPNFTASGDRIPSINKTREAIATVVARAGNALTSQQKIVLQRVARELEQANFAATAAKPAGSETELNRTFKDLIHFVPGSGIAKALLSKVLGALGNGPEVRSLITQALLDPDFAATLLKRPTEQHWVRVQRNLIGRKATVGSALAAQPANDVQPLHSLLVNALARSPGEAAARQNVDDRRQVPPQEQRQPQPVH